jgi:hypothetical protein
MSFKSCALVAMRAPAGMGLKRYIRILFLLLALHRRAALAILGKPLAALVTEYPTLKRVETMIGILLPRLFAEHGKPRCAD